MRSESQTAFIQLLIELRDPLLKGAPIELQMEVAETKIEELFVAPGRPPRKGTDIGWCR
jgi:hypothetical protein